MAFSWSGFGRGEKGISDSKKVSKFLSFSVVLFLLLLFLFLNEESYQEILSRNWEWVPDGWMDFAKIHLKVYFE